jgi:hypothetical protein
MPARLRRTIDFAGLILAAALAARLKFELDYSWSVTICSVVMVALPFIVPRLWAKFAVARLQREATVAKRRDRLLAAEFGRQKDRMTVGASRPLGDKPQLC